MSGGLYPIAQIARWLKKKPREMKSLIEDHGLPVVPIPATQGTVDKVTLHGLHEWLRKRAKGSAFMSVEQLATELEMCAEGHEDSTHEAELLGEIASLAEASRDMLRKGLDPKSVRRALSDVTAEWLNLNVGSTPV